MSSACLGPVQGMACMGRSARGSPQPPGPLVALAPIQRSHTAIPVPAAASAVKRAWRPRRLEAPGPCSSLPADATKRRPLIPPSRRGPGLLLCPVAARLHAAAAAVARLPPTPPLPLPSHHCSKTDTRRCLACCCVPRQPQILWSACWRCAGAAVIATCWGRLACGWAHLWLIDESCIPSCAHSPWVL